VFLFFLLAALYMIRSRISLQSYILAGILVSISFLTKQVALPISIPLMIYAVYSNRRNGLVFVGVVFLLSGLSTLALNHVHDGWYYFYCFDLPRQHALVKKMYAGFWLYDLLAPLPIACFLSVVCILIQAAKSRKAGFAFFSLMAAAMLGGAWVSRLHAGGYPNVLFPAYAAISILFGIAVHETIKLIPTQSLDRVNAMKVFVYHLCLIQFLLLIYNPCTYIPTKEDATAGWEFVETMAKMEGELFVPCHGYVPTLAGKRSYAHAMAVYDVMRGDNIEVKERLILDIRQAIGEKEFSAIIIDSFLPNRLWFRQATGGFCIRERPVFDDEAVFWTVTGKRTRPEVIMELCPEEEPVAVSD
jgi:hypothetical protein